jgi:hypothetical protein
MPMTSRNAMPSRLGFAPPTTTNRGDPSFFRTMRPKSRRVSWSAAQPAGLVFPRLSTSISACSARRTTFLRSLRAPSGMRASGWSSGGAVRESSSAASFS